MSRIPTGSRYFPLLFLYDEYNQSDFVESVHWQSTFSAQLGEIFALPAPWDRERKYLRVDHLSLFYDSPPLDRYVVVPLHFTVERVLRSPSYRCPRWLPTFHVVPKDSPYDLKWRENR